MVLSNRIIITILFILAFLVWLFPGNTPAGAQAQWELCQNGEQITSCTTYDCPNGDTNGDGACTLDDEGGRVTSARQDALCGNPVSGCGTIHYFNQNGANSCLLKTQEFGPNCDLYSVSTAQFTPAPKPQQENNQPIAVIEDEPIATTEAKTVEELPETGSEALGIAALVVLGFLGIHLYDRFKLV